MKKKLSVLLSLILVFAMTFTLFGCGEDNDSDDDESGSKSGIVGTWEGDIDMTSFLNNMLSGSGITLNDFKFTMIFEFKIDGTYKCSADPESLKNAAVGMFEDMASAAGMTLDQLLAASGVSSIDELIESSFSTDDITEGITSEGKYKLEGDKLYYSEDADSEISEDEYDTIKLSKNTLEFVSHTGDSADEETIAAFYPLTFKRVK